MQTLFFAIWFFLPAAIANMSPVLATHIPLLDQWSFPLDFHLSFRGKRILGDHKTFRGFLVGIIVGIIVTKLQFLLLSTFFTINFYVPPTYSSLSPGLLGFLLSFGALTGDSMKSFFKRQLNIAEGKSFFPFDQIDFILGAMLASLLIIRFSIVVYVIIVICYTLLHVIVSYVGYLLHLKDFPI